MSFGLAALAQTIDRIIVGRSVGPEELGAYGAIADFLRQGFVVFGESIALALVSIAKREVRAGALGAAEAVLADAARALALVGAFGAVFVLAYDDVLVAVLLGPGYRAQALALAPILLAASILLMVRAYYFGQVIYFTRTSHLDAVASAALLATVGGLSWLLIPRLGALGAALAFAAGQAIACLVFVVGGRRGPETFRMPVPAGDIGGILALALLAWAAILGIGLLPGGQGAPARLAGLAILAAGFLAAAWRFNVVGLADLVARRRAAR
nr:hypothetical protein [Methylobacterium durans]